MRISNHAGGEIRRFNWVKITHAYFGKKKNYFGIRGKKFPTRQGRVGDTSTLQTGQRYKNRTFQVISPTMNFYKIT